MSAKWRSGFRANIPANVAYEEVADLHQEYGLVKPNHVVDRARPKTNSLHPQFEWDDSYAAERYREDQARRLLRNLVVIVVEGEEEKEFSPAFISVTVQEGEGGDRGYVSVATVLTDDDMREQAINDTVKALNGLRRRYSALQRFVDILESMESMVLSELRLDS